MKKLKDIKTLCELQDFILYGDLQKVPISILGPNWAPENRPEMVDFDDEQMLRVKMAAALEYFIKINKGKHEWRSVLKTPTEKSPE